MHPLEELVMYRTVTVPNSVLPERCVMNRTRTRWLVEFISVAFSFLTALFVVTVTDIAKHAKRRGLKRESQKHIEDGIEE
jgi:hypothetical protein